MDNSRYYIKFGGPDLKTVYMHISSVLMDFYIKSLGQVKNSDKGFVCMYVCMVFFKF